MKITLNNTEVKEAIGLYLEDRYDLTVSSFGSNMEVEVGDISVEIPKPHEYVITLCEWQGSAVDKINHIKAVRKINPSMGLKEAKELVESIPIDVLHTPSLDACENAEEILREAGGEFLTECRPLSLN